MSIKKRTVRKDLINRIYKKTDGTIPFRKLYQAINLIVDGVTQDLVDNQIVTIGNFGTFSPCVRKGSLGNNVSIGKVMQSPEKKGVKFFPNISFLSLLRDKKSFYKSKISNDKKVKKILTNR